MPRPSELVESSLARGRSTMKLPLRPPLCENVVEQKDMTMRSLFERKGQTFVPTEMCRGPQGKYGLLHRGPATALLARAVEMSDGAEGTFVTSVAVEVLRPILFESFETFARLVRRGRAVEVVEAVLSTGASPVMRMIAVRIRHPHFARAPRAIDEMRSAARAERDGAFAASPERARASSVNTETVVDAPSRFHAWGVEHRLIRVPCDERGPAADWMRLKVALLSDEPTSALCRVCAVADVGLGLSSEPAPWRSTLAPDLTVRIQRQPQGEWVCVDRTSGRDDADDDGGVGGAITRLFDRKGSIGHARREQVVEESRRTRSGDFWIARREQGAGR